MAITALPSLISFILLLGAGFYILKKGIMRPSNWLFALAIFDLCAIEFANSMVLISHHPLKVLFWQRGVFLGLSLLPIFWTTFSLTFARENYIASLKKWGWYLVLLSIISLWFLRFLPTQSLIKGIKTVPGGYGFALGTLGHHFFIFLLLILVVVCLNFENAYRCAQGRQREKIKYAIRGMGVILSSYIILSSLALLFSYVDSRYTILGSVVIIVGAVLVAYSVFRQGFIDTDVYVGRQAIYTSATLSIVGLYLFMVGWVARIFISSGINLKTFFSFLAAFFVFLTFLLLIFSKSLKEKLRLFIDRTFYKDKYDYRREWGSLSERLGAILNIDELILEIKKIVKEIMPVDSVELTLINPHNEIDGFSNWLLRYAQPIPIQEFSQRNEKLYKENERFFKEWGHSCILVPLIAKQKMLGILAIGRKSNGGRFSAEDLELLKTIGKQVSVAILNAKLSEEVIVSREMEHFHKLSSFLIHDLKNFVTMLSLIVQNAARNSLNPEFQKDSLNTLSETIFKMNNLMSRLSNLPKELELRLKSVDINALIEEMIAKSKILQEEKFIKVIKELNGIPKLLLDREYIEKVILNLILNAKEAMPEGGTLRISSGNCASENVDDGYVKIAISDTGCGMSQEFIERYLFKPFQSTKKKGLGIGLFQCKTIIEAHNGKIEVDSQVNKGTIFRVKLPTKNKKWTEKES